MTTPRRCWFVLTTLTLLAIVQAAQALWVVPPEAPVDRLIKNTKAFLAKHPGDARGHYVLGRIHALAYALKTKNLAASFDENNIGKRLPRVPENPEVQRGGKANAGRPDADALLAHLKASLKHQYIAMETFPLEGLIRLGVASTLHEGAKDAAAVGWPAKLEAPAQPLSKADGKRFAALMARLKNQDASAKNAEAELAKHAREAAPLFIEAMNSKHTEQAAASKRLLTVYWKVLAIEHYLKAHDLTVKNDLKKRVPTIDNNHDLIGLISYEAAKHATQLATDTPVPARFQPRLKKAAAYVTQVDKKVKAFAITPIVLALDARRPLGDLIDAKARVHFDLAGDGIARTWPWVRPSTGLLVWDPQQKGRITSGRQLFGNRTWWIFWSNGFDAMAALDDNTNGWLEGAELDGLGIWFDHNANARSDAGEVRPIADTGVRRLAVRPTGKAGDGRSPVARGGVQMQDGRRLPLYDWVAQAK